MLGTAVTPGPTTPMQSLLYPNCSSPLSKVIVKESLQDWCRMDLSMVNIGEGEGTRCSGRSDNFIFNLAAEGREESRYMMSWRSMGGMGRITTCPVLGRSYLKSRVHLFLPYLKMEFNQREYRWGQRRGLIEKTCSPTGRNWWNWDYLPCEVRSDLTEVYKLTETSFKAEFVWVFEGIGQPRIWRDRFNVRETKNRLILLRKAALMEWFSPM